MNYWMRYEENHKLWSSLIQKGRSRDVFYSTVWKTMKIISDDSVHAEKGMNCILTTRRKTTELCWTLLPSLDCVFLIIESMKYLAIYLFQLKLLLETTHWLWRMLSHLSLTIYYKISCIYIRIYTNTYIYKHTHSYISKWYFHCLMVQFLKWLNVTLAYVNEQNEGCNFALYVRSIKWKHSGWVVFVCPRISPSKQLNGFQLNFLTGESGLKDILRIFFYSQNNPNLHDDTIEIYRLSYNQSYNTCVNIHHRDHCDQNFHNIFFRFCT
jgi:uncharacterized membrane protein